MISITGGNDLTLYEVDEAASRIRQEVDEEANIILGATFDSALDGVVRVSVVATGIDQAAIERGDPVAAMPRIETTRISAGAVASRPVPRRPSVAAAAEVVAPIASAVFPSEMFAERSRGPPGRARSPRSVVEPEPAPRYEEPAEEEFVPPAPRAASCASRACRRSRTCRRSRRRSCGLHRGEAAPAPAPAETRRRSLLEKLAAFGINRSEEAEPPRRRCAWRSPPPRQASRQRALHAEYGRPAPRSALPRAAQGQLDPQGRAAPRPAPSEDDQLEIPGLPAPPGRPLISGETAAFPLLDSRRKRGIPAPAFGPGRSFRRARMRAIRKFKYMIYMHVIWRR